MRYKWIGIIVLMYLCTLIDGIASDLGLMENLPGYAVISSIEQLNRSRCRTEMEQFRDAVDRRILWSLKMLDTSGQPSSGYILGNNFWMGNRVQCESLSQKLPFVYSPQNAKNNSRFRNPADEYPPFELNFFGAYIHERGTIQYRHTSMSREDVIILGLCLPASCTENEVTTMVTKVIDDRLLLADRLYSMDLKLLRVSDLRPDYALFFNAKIIIIILILTALFSTVTAGTLYDMLVVQKKLKEYKEYSSDQSKVSELQDTGEMELNNIVEKKVSLEKIGVIQKPKTVSRSKGILTYFSIYSNLKEIFNVNNLSEDLKVIHGIRVFGSVWIILAHVIIYRSNTSDRGQVFLNLGTLPYQIPTNATLAVETYFFLGGFILTFGYIKSQRKPRSFRECAIGFIGGIIKRYVRLTPPQVVTILIVIVTFTYLSHTSLVFPIEPAHESCSKYWWQNVLYINNFFEWKDICMSWTWYISNDMQLYMLGTFLLMLSTCYYYATLSLSVTIIITASVYRAYVTYATEYHATVDTIFETLSSMYIRPWMRVQTYLLGMGTALILHKLNYKLHLSKKVVAVCWCLSVLCNCSILFGVPSVNKALVSSIIYEAFFKIGWSLGIGWLIVACATNNGVISSIEQLNRSRCRTEMEQFRDAIDRRILWSLKMLDTSGQPSSGYILGNNFWLGNRPQCESLSQKLPFVYSPQNAKNNSRFRNPADEYPPFELNFFGAYIHQGGTIQYHTSTFPEDVIILGLCLPASCTEDEVTTMVTKVIDDKLLLADRLYSMDLKLLRVSDLRPDYALFFNAKIIIIILILTALLGTVTAGTLYDMLVVQKKLREYKEYSSDQSKVSELQDTGEIELNNIVEKKAPHEEIAVIQKPKTVSRSKGILTYFSIYSNLKEIFNVNNTSEDLKMIHGLKVFGTVTIIVGHAMAYKSNIADRGQLFIIMSTLWYQIIANATLVVETYFFLSGFILTFGYIKLQRKPRSFRECAIGFIGGIIKRYVRLTSAQVVTILIVIVTFTYLANTSLFFMNEPAHELCSKYWWANVLYINNFFEWQDLCMSWTWYISNDMQFFMLGIFLLMLSTSYYYASLSLSVTMIIAASAYRAYVTYVTEYLATNDAKFETLSFMYIRPWMRIQPYLLGMGTALILHKLNYKLHLSKVNSHYSSTEISDAIEWHLRKW
ncbi:uncharacterized protein LOC143265791 isoform X2 [Megachile rotundata]|uniref:uncharacterized protein LOC143265791 isoform X2 n=1 Tax=Megachile rotundata TaxID=143995 RepID=UPI003FD47B50